jgi:16S rRNA U516 pseudouridylate synthase RsuA-like enzyme
MPIGRLDLNTEGLLLLTNDGGLKRRWNCPPAACRAPTARALSAR